MLYVLGKNQTNISINQSINTSTKTGVSICRHNRHQIVGLDPIMIRMSS